MKKILEKPWVKTIIVVFETYLIYFGVGLIFTFPVRLLVVKPISYLVPEIGDRVSPSFGPLRVWIAFIIVAAIVKRHTDGRVNLFDIFTIKRKGNTVRNCLIGLLLGFVMNIICIMAAQSGGCFTLGVKDVKPLSFIIMFIGTFIQSSSEELMYRGFMFEGIRKCHRSVLPAIVITTLLFSFNHGAIPGYFPIMLFLNFAAWGILYSLSVLHTDGIWMSFGMHTMWNFTQAYICGLSNTGIILPSSLFAPVSAPVYSILYNCPLGASAELYNSIGDYGVENGIVAPIVMGIAAVILFFIYKKNKATA
ncbi:MAG: CPBP family intramembrane metalloprotease [Lachnospiraceae bacterium]|nr:CPBP family intramembrane metalloprotease [Lachnospiraceae bacterium]